MLFFKKIEVKSSVKISVVVLTYLDFSNLERCLGSLTRQSFVEQGFSGQVLNQNQWETLIIDNASSPRAKALVDQYIKQYPEINFIYIKNNINNIGAARAMGVNKARGEYIVFIDSDSCAETGWLQELYSKFLNMEKGYKNLAGMAGSAKIPTQGFGDLVNLMFSSFFGHFGSPQAAQIPNLSSVEHLPTNNAIFRKDALLNVGNFSPLYSRVCEDVDLGIRLKAAGYNLIWVSEPSIWHFTALSFSGWSHRMFRFGQGRSKIFFEYPLRLGFHGYVPLLALASVIIALVALSPFQFFILLSGYFTAVLFLSLLISFRSGVTSKFVGLSFLFVATHGSYFLGYFLGYFCGTILLLIYSLKTLGKFVANRKNSDSFLYKKLYKKLYKNKNVKIF